MKIRVCILILTTSVLYSCSTRFLYNHLDWALEWYIDDLVTLTDNQEWQVRVAIESLLDWHRKNQLPFYVSTLEEAETAVKSEITLSFLKRFYYGHEKAWMNLKYHITPTMAGLLKTLSDSQITELQKNMKEQEEDVTKDYRNKTTEQIVNDRITRMIDRLDYWIGDLNKEQEQIVVSWSHRVKPQTTEWMSSRAMWQTNFLKIVRASRHKSEFNELMLEHFQNSRKYWPDGYEQAYYFNVELTLKMITALGRNLSDKQKEKLLDRIGDIKEQLIEIYKED